MLPRTCIIEKFVYVEFCRVFFLSSSITTTEWDREWIVSRSTSTQSVGLATAGRGLRLFATSPPLVAKTPVSSCTHCKLGTVLRLSVVWGEERQGGWRSSLERFVCCVGMFCAMCIRTFQKHGNWSSLELFWLSTHDFIVKENDTDNKKKNVPSRGEIVLLSSAQLSSRAQT